jgi:hypothetical protein
MGIREWFRGKRQLNANNAPGNKNDAQYYNELTSGDPLFNENDDSYSIVFQDTKQPTPGAMSWANEGLQQRQDTCIGTGIFIPKPIVPFGSVPMHAVQSIPTKPLGSGGYQVAGTLYLQPLFDPANPNGYSSPLWDGDPIEFAQ